MIVRPSLEPRDLSAQTSLSVLLAASAPTSAPMPTSLRWSLFNASCDDGEGSHTGRDVIQPRQMARQTKVSA